MMAAHVGATIWTLSAKAEDTCAMSQHFHSDWREMHVCVMSSKRYVTERAWRNCYSRHLEIISISVSTGMDKEIICEGILQCNENEETVAVSTTWKRFTKLM